jgi:stage V sporulation protein SpoVS
MSGYDSKLITAKAQAQVLAVVKHAIDQVDVKATAAVPKVTTAVEQNVPVFVAGGAVADSGVKMVDIQKKISPAVAGNFVATDTNGFVKDSGKKPGDFQPIDALLTSISAIAGTQGIFALNGLDIAEVRKIVDADIASNEAIFYAMKAFINKNGSIVVAKDQAIINGDTGKQILKDNGSAVVLGDGENK